MSETERELERLKNKAKVWESLHPDAGGHCGMCPHLWEIKWCDTNPRLVLDKKTNKALIASGELHRLGIGGEDGCRCLEWIKNV